MTSATHIALHGFTGNESFWHGHSVSTLPILGHSNKARAIGNETFSNERDRLANLLPATPIHLIGYSLGARLALAIAISNTKNISKLTLISGSPGIADLPERNQRKQWDQSWVTMLREQGIETFVHAWEALPMWESQLYFSEAKRGTQRNQRLQHDPMQLAFAMDSLGTGSMPSLWEMLPTLSIPVHLIIGELDRKYRTLADAMQTKLPTSQQSIIPSCGHNPVFEAPELLSPLLFPN